MDQVHEQEQQKNRTVADNAEEPRVLYESTDLPDGDDVEEIMAKIGVRVDHDEWPPEPEPLAADADEDDDAANQPSPAAAEQPEQGKAEPRQWSLFPELETSEPQPQSAQNPEPEPDPTSEKPKRNSGRTGPTTPEGKMKTHLNALRHGCCARTLVLGHENPQDYLKLYEHWEQGYPHESNLLKDFLLRTAQAEWQRIRAQEEYNTVLDGFTRPEIYNLSEEERHSLDLQQRYLTTAERKFQREFGMLERFWNNHCKPDLKASPKPEPQPEKPVEPKSSNTNNSKEEYLEPWEEDPPAGIDPTKVRFTDAESGEYWQDGKFYPPPPDWKPVKLYPGYRHPLDPANWRYEGDPKERFKPKKRPKPDSSGP